MTSSKEVLTPAELRERLDIGRFAYRSLLRAGLPSLLIGGQERLRRRHSWPAVERWLSERRPRHRRGRPHAETLAGSRR